MFLKYLLVLSLIKLVLANGRFPPIPCPQMFEYSWDGQRYYGTLTINNFYSTQVILEVKLSQNSALDKGNFGQISFDQDKSNFREGCFVYRVDFPLQNEFPAIKSIILNGNIVCQASSPAVTGARQTIVLFHSLKYSFPKQINEVSQNGGNNILSNLFLNMAMNRNQEPERRREIQSQRPLLVPSTNRIPETKLTNVHEGVVKTHNVEQHHQQTQVASPPVTPKEKAASGLVCNFVQRISKTSNELPSNTQFPWQAGIFRKGIVGLNFTCDGSLISAQTVVTSAECLQLNNVSSANAVIFLGWNLLDNNNESEVVIREAERIIVHPDFYKNATNSEDIALMQLKKPISFTENIHPICLWSDYKTNKKRTNS